MTLLGLKMIIFGHFSRFLASFKISFTSLQHPSHNPVGRFCAIKSDQRKCVRAALYTWPMVGLVHEVVCLERF